MKAIILSAGQGKRLLPLTESRPKCLVQVGGHAVLDWQLDALAQNGVTEAVVVTGFGADIVEGHLAQGTPPGLAVRTVFNPFYAVADNLGTCFFVRGEMTGLFLIMNGDTVCEPAIVARLLAEARAPISVTIDRKARYDADDMKVSLDGERLTAIGKTLEPAQTHGESIGLLRFDPTGADTFVAGVEAAMRRPDGVRQWYLSVIDEIAHAARVGVVSIEGLRWGELDFPADLDNLERVVASWPS